MDDLISRWELLREYQNVCNCVECIQCPFLTEDKYCKLEQWIEGFTSTQSNTQNTFQRVGSVGDTISRQAVIDELGYCQTYLFDSRDKDKKISLEDAEYVIEQLPSVQPEIIYCKDCKHFIRDDITEYTCYGFYNEYFRAFCDKHWNKDMGEYEDAYLDGFCSYAERRTNE